VPSFAIDAVTWMPSITIWPPPRLTRPRLDSPLVTKVLPSSVARVDELSSVSPSPGVDAVDADVSDRDFGADDCGVAPGIGKPVDGTVTGGAGLAPPAAGVVTGATGVVTGALGVVTFTFGAVGFGSGAFGSGVFGSVTVATGVVTVGVGFVGARPCHFAFQPASACCSWPLNPLGTARVGAPLGSPGPLNPFDAREASAVAR
jgi:hypothetical protein